MAFAVIGPVPLAGSPGLPDGRVYEQVSPANKHGNAAAPPVAFEPPAMFAESEGEGIAYSVAGAPLGSTQSGAQFYIVAKRTGEQWVNVGTQPRSLGEQVLLANRPQEIGFSADLSRVLFSDFAPYPGLPPNQSLRYGLGDGLLEWIDPPPASNGPTLSAVPIAVAGFSSDMSTFYFGSNSGFYEWHEGTLSVAGVLPDGTVDPSAVAAGVLTTSGRSVDANELRNQVSPDGTRAFFVSAEPNLNCEPPQHAKEHRSECPPPQLYVRENGDRTTLVSRDELLTKAGEPPAQAPDGVNQLAFPLEGEEGEALSAGGGFGAGDGFISPGFAYASSDGSHVFFESTDALTGPASEAEEHGLPANDVKAYVFDTQTDRLRYLPGVADAPEVNRSGTLYGPSSILASSQDGSRSIFNSPSGLSLWAEGPDGGSVAPIEPFQVGGEAQATPDGSVFVFESAAPLAGFNNGGNHVDIHGSGPLRNQEIYRYDVAENSLTCTSCPPAGIAPSGNAYLSHTTPNPNTSTNRVLSASNAISADGSRVFFDTPDPLVPQDTNTGPLQPTHEGLLEVGRDVYEWENGSDFLISTGTSLADSYLGGASANGDDVFFSTTQGLSPGDTDEGYDVYDARVPRPGDHAPPPAAPCAGDVCQGPPSVPSLLGAPASATFSGLGNPPPEPATAPAAKPKAKTKGCKKGFVKHKNRCVKNKKSQKAKKASNKRGAK